MNKLKSGIDRMIETQNEYDLADIFSAYDDLLWKIFTADIVELENVVKNIWQQTNCEIPVPLQVLACRMFLSKSHRDISQVKPAIEFIRCHCSGQEERNVLEGI